MQISNLRLEYRDFTVYFILIMVILDISCIIGRREGICICHIGIQINFIQKDTNNDCPQNLGDFLCLDIDIYIVEMGWDLDFFTKAK